MCGICGSTIAGANLQIALEEMSHRGPDGSGMSTIDGIAFGHVLLAIQDPGRASQPMKSRSGNSLLTYNGEIYNHLELRSLLPNFPWKTNSDSETVLELLEEFGSRIASEFRGMYAIAYWNTHEKTLHLMRDYFGEKPLYYVRNESGALHFSSEVRNLAIISDLEQRFSIQAMRHYLKYLYFDPIHTIYSGIRSVPPGSELIIKKQEVHQRMTHPEYLNTELDPELELRTSIIAAVRRTLLADVPVGIMLSGGIDSTIVASVASLEQPGISTFTLRRNQDDDDIRFARLAAERYRTNHHEVEIDKSTLHNDIYYVLAKASQPFADTSLIPTFLLSKYASRYVKVLLSGDGADELFGGYTHYEMYRRANIGNQTWLDYVFKHLKFMASKNTRSKNVWKFFFDSNLAALESGRRTFQEQWNRDSEILTDKQVNRIFNANGIVNKYSGPNQRSINSLRDILDLDLKSYLPADILFKSDIAGMLASLEIRAPFLDLDVSRVRNAIDPSLLGNKKRVLVDAFRSELPPEITSRNKAGFGAPVDDWFLIPSVNDMAEEIIQDKSNSLYNVMNFKEVQKMIRTKGNLVKWEILSLLIWVKENA